MDQAELRRRLLEQLDQTPREQARPANFRERMRYEWAEEQARLKAKVTEISRHLRETPRSISFPEMFQKVGETRSRPDVCGALMAATTQRLAQMDLQRAVDSGHRSGSRAAFAAF